MTLTEDCKGKRETLDGYMRATAASRHGAPRELHAGDVAKPPAVFQAAFGIRPGAVL